MKLLNAIQIKELDAFTLSEENIYSHELMERASLAASHWIQMNFKATQLFSIFCGIGNNGGDGLCIARHLYLSGYKTKIYIVGEIGNGSTDFKYNLNRLQNLQVPFLEITEINFPILENTTTIIDAIFGSGLNKKINAKHATLIEKLNKSISIKISIDTPSGFFISQPTIENCIHANYTLSFQLPKLGFLFPENHKYVGKFILLNIHLSKKFLQQVPCKYFYSTINQFSECILKRKTFDHKGTFGHSLLIGGAEKMQGAIALAAKSCLVTGSGLVTACSFSKLETVSEILWLPLQTTQNMNFTKYQTIGIGPGLDLCNQSKDVLFQTLQNFQLPIVLDADALTILSEKKNWLVMLPKNSILTPHPKEFERLFGSTKNSFDQLALQVEMSKKYTCIIILKRAYSAITFPNGEVHFNSSGNPGMATAGSGDVLTGIIASFLAQKYSPELAALLGTFIHGLAGDLAVIKNEFQIITASQIIEQIPHAYAQIKDTK